MHSGLIVKASATGPKVTSLHELLHVFFWNGPTACLYFQAVCQFSGPVARAKYILSPGILGPVL